MITDIAADGPAAQAGLSAGDVIMEVDGKATRTASDVERALEAGGSKPRLLRVRNEAGTRFVTLPAPARQ